MPLKSTDLTRLTARIESRLPPRDYDRTLYAGGSGGVVSGYLNEVTTSRPIDDFGEPDFTAIFHLVDGLLQEGDELAHYYVTWSELPGTTYPRYALRRLFPFQDWTATVRAVDTVDTETEQTSYNWISSTVKLYLLDIRPTVARDSSLVEDTSAVRIVDRDKVLSPESVVTLGGRGRFKIDVVQPYGPYQLAFGEAA